MLRRSSGVMVGTRAWRTLTFILCFGVGLANDFVSSMAVALDSGRISDSETGLILTAAACVLAAAFVMTRVAMERATSLLVELVADLGAVRRFTEALAVIFLTFFATGFLAELTLRLAATFFTGFFAKDFLAAATLRFAVDFATTFLFFFIFFVFGAICPYPIFFKIACWNLSRTPSNGMRCIIGSKKPSTTTRSASFCGMPRDLR